MKQIITSLIRLYQSLGQLWHGSVPVAPACRFYPTCSQYALDAVEKYGVFRGSVKALVRIARCHPLAKSGVDFA